MLMLMLVRHDALLRATTPLRTTTTLSHHHHYHHHNVTTTSTTSTLRYEENDYHTTFDILGEADAVVACVSVAAGLNVPAHELAHLFVG